MKAQDDMNLLSESLSEGLGSLEADAHSRVDTEQIQLSLSFCV